MRTVKLLLFVLVTGVFAASTGFALMGNSFKAKLTSKEETQSLVSRATGHVEFKLSKDGTALSYQLKVKNLVNANAAHIHMAKKGADGPPVAGLFSGEKKGKFSGILSQGTIMAKDLIGPLQGKTVADLVDSFKSGDAYVNVHTDANPDGEIRGQIK